MDQEERQALKDAEQNIADWSKPNLQEGNICTEALSGKCKNPCCTHYQVHEERNTCISCTCNKNEDVQVSCVPYIKQEWNIEATFVWKNQPDFGCHAAAIQLYGILLEAGFEDVDIKLQKREPE
jgi:hypothetical protein